MGEDKSNPGALDEFLHPKSMLTPGIAGGLTTLITNVLTTRFGLLPHYTGLVVSFLFGLIVFRTTAVIPWWQRAVYFCLNSLVIFSVAMGANQAGVRLGEAHEPRRPPEKPASASVAEPFFSNWLDSTVPKRKALLAELPELDESEARYALDLLQVSVPEGSSPTNTLTWYAASARTADEVDKINLALSAKPENEDERKPKAPIP